MKNHFCDYCGRRSDGLFKESVRSVDVKGDLINVRYTSIVCPYCGEEIFDEQTEHDIYQTAITAYRARRKMLRPATIAAILKKIPACKLAEMAGCSEREIYGLANGAIISTETDTALRTVIMAL